MYPSPLADGGYDIADFTGVDPRLGTLDDVAELIAEAHRRGLRLLLDLVPNHTSIEHPWFREHPDWYVWADAPANNWRAAFGGPAWTRDERSGRWYLHSFYPEQPDLDWRNPEVVTAMQDVVRTWLGRGVDGFRVDAIDTLGQAPRPARRPARDRAAAVPRAPRRGRARAAPLPQLDAGAPPRPGGAARGGRRRLPGRRGVPADRRARARTSTTSPPRSCSSSYSRTGEPMRSARRSSARPPRAGGVDALEPRLRPGRPRASGRATCAPPRCCCTRSPGRSSSTRATRSASWTARGRPARRPLRPRPRPPPDAVGRRPQGGFTTGTPWLPPSIRPAQRRRPARRPDIAVVAPSHADRASARPPRGPRARCGRVRRPARLPPRRRPRDAQPGGGDAAAACRRAAPAHPSRTGARAGRRCDRPRVAYGHAVGHRPEPDRRGDRLPAGPAAAGARRPFAAAAARARRHQPDPPLRRGGARARPQGRARRSACR